MVDADEEPFPLWFSHPVPLHEALVEVDGRTTVEPVAGTGVLYADADEETAAAVIAACAASGSGRPADRSCRSGLARGSRRHTSCAPAIRRCHPEVQRTMARHADHVVEWDADHSPFVSDPVRVAALLADLATDDAG